MPPIRSDGDSEHRTVVSFQPSQFLPALHRPHSHRLVITPTHNMQPITGDGKRPH
eukprot:EC794699.1.p3 GENE.EC794699.1~~EC794699.1.p3  ORF type:complete len:55 (-),score=4.96 EC794699.1:155-319(-)